MSEGRFKVHAGNFRSNSYGQWVYDHLRLKNDGKLRREKILADQIIKCEIENEKGSKNSKGTLTVVCELNDGRKFLASMSDKVFTSIQSAMFNVSIGKKIHTPFPYRPWKKWEKIVFNTVMSPIYLFMLIAVFGILFGRSDNAEVTLENPQRETIQQFAETYPNEIELHTDWEALELAEASDDQITYYIYYKSKPSISHAKEDTTWTAEAIRMGLMAAGYSPSSDQIKITVFAFKKAKGSNGEGVLQFGRARYSPYKDMVEFKLD